MMKSFFLALVFSISYLIVSAQISSIPSNLSNVRSQDISEEQLGQVVSQMKQGNYTSAQLYELALQRGMAPAEAAALKTRIDNYAGGTSTVTSNAETVTRESSQRAPDISIQNNNTAPVSNPEKIFGLEIFNNGVLSFEPNLKIATPTNYVIGPDDEISIAIYGYQEARYNLTVSPEGDINIPLVGVVYVSGLTMEQASEKIRNKLAANGYANIRTGLTKVNISLGKIRSIRITVLGEVRKPGTYTLTSLSSAFNALYLSGGPNNIGSMRLIEIIRNGKVIEHLDIYDFLVRGDQTGNIRLQDQDIIRVPPYKVRVSMEGEVKRNGLFEVIPGENFQQLLDYAGGFTDSAYTASVKVYKVTDTEKRITDISKEDYKTYQPSRSERFVIRKIIDRFTNRVVIRGAVYLPGEYELTPGMTIKDVIQKAQGLREDAFLGRGIIVRYLNDLTTSIVQFSPGDVMSGKTENLPLVRNDEITISSKFDLKETYRVSVNGEVRHPGDYGYNENMTLKDVIFFAGGFTDAASPQRIEIARRLKKDSISFTDPQIAEVINVQSEADLNTIANDVKLQPFDVVMVRKNPGYMEQVNVSIKGEVFYPGSYVLGSRNETISDLIRRSGGVTPQAYLKGAYLTRVNRNDAVKEAGLGRIMKIQRDVKDSSGVIMQDVTAPTVKMAVNLEQIMQHPHSTEDVVLQEGDELNVTKEVFEVKVNGEVMFPTQVVFKPGEDLLYYIDKAGGFSDDARKNKTYVLYGNGNAAKTRKFLFIKSFPKIEPGAEVLVPKIPERKKSKMTTGEIVAITSGVASLVGVVVALLNFLK